MRFDIPGYTPGPTDRDLERLERQQLRLEAAHAGSDEEEARRLGLSVEQWRRFRASLEAARR